MYVVVVYAIIKIYNFAMWVKMYNCTSSFIIHMVYTDVNVVMMVKRKRRGSKSTLSFKKSNKQKTGKF